MKYNVKQDKKEELKNGRSCVYISEKTDCTASYISEVFRGKKSCSKCLAILMIAIKNNFINMDNIEQELNIYFNEDK